MMDAEDVMKREPCAVCEGLVEDFAPGVSSVTHQGELYHPECLSAEYARQVRDHLTTGATQTRSATLHPLLSESEGEEMVESYLLNVPAVTFAAKLEARDIALFESSIDKEMVSPVTS